MNNKIETNLFWINNFRSELSLYSEAMSLFCGIILYHISDFNESFSKALRNSLVKTALTNLTVCIYKMNPNASKEDVATSIRTFLYEYIEDYDSFELELLKYIPDVNSEEVFCYSILNASSDYDDLDDHESEDYIRQELARINIQVLKISALTALGIVPFPYFEGGTLSAPSFSCTSRSVFIPASMSSPVLSSLNSLEYQNCS